MNFEKLKQFFRRLFGLEKPQVKMMAEVKGFPEKWHHYPSPKMSKLGFKPKTAYEKRLWKEKSEEDG